MTMRRVLDYAYTGRVEINVDNAQEMMAAGEKIINIKNISSVDIYAVANWLNSETIMVCVFQFNWVNSEIRNE